VGRRHRYRYRLAIEQVSESRHQVCVYDSSSPDIVARHKDWKRFVDFGDVRPLNRTWTLAVEYLESYVNWLIAESADELLNHIYPNPKLCDNGEEVADALIVCGDSLAPARFAASRNLPCASTENPLGFIGYGEFPGQRVNCSSNAVSRMRVGR
jgi:hypothetical protein